MTLARPNLPCVPTATIVLALALASSCGSSSEAFGTTTSSETTTFEASQPDTTTSAVIVEQTTDTLAPQICTPSAPVTPRPGALLEMLRHVPNEDAYREAVRFNDIGRFNLDASLDLPSPDCDDDIEAYADASFEGMGLFPGALASTPSEGIQSELDAWGFSFLDHTAWMQTGLPANPLRLRLADIDGQQVAEAVATDADWADEVDLVDDLFFDWGRSIDFDRESPARPFGRGGSLAVGDGIVIQADDVEVVAASLGAFEQGTGLDGDEHFNALAVELDARGVHGAFMTNEVARPTSFEFRHPDDVAAIPDLVAAFPFLPKPGAVALGWTDLGDSGEFTVAMSATSPGEAQVMVDAIVARAETEIPEIKYSWIDRFSVAEAAVVDNLAVVVFTAQQRVWLDRMVIGLFLAPSN